jgi:16S rRNA (cytidine1402-2'-O)-methyltransferase
LYVVATPIGNLEDITLRALKVLKAVNLVAAEDTRRTGMLLRHYEISTPLLSVHEHNERLRAASIVGRLAAGESIALVTDAGTPAISDPGALLVRAVREAGFAVEPIPGPSAISAALSASGLLSEGFAFLGFPPSRLNDRNCWLAKAAEESSKRAVVFFESPHRVLATLKGLSLLVEYHICACRELTKVHEEIRWGSPLELAEVFSEPKGEFTIIIPPRPAEAQAHEELSDADIAHEFGHMTLNTPGSSRREAVRKLADKLQLPVRAVYASLERAKLVERHNLDD